MENSKNPKVNEVWRLKSGNLAIIVNGCDGENGKISLRLLWHDKIDNDLNVSAILDRLAYKTDLSPSDVMIRWMLVSDQLDPIIV